MSQGSLAIVGVLWNPLRHERLRQNFHRWRENLPKDSAVQNWLIEVVPRGRKPELPPAERTVHFELEDHIWCIESARNAVIRSRITDVDAVMCMDADLVFSQPGWWKVVMATLEKHPVIQPYKTGVWLDVSNKVQDKRRSLSWGYTHGNMGPWPARLGTLHPGFAWAARSDLWGTVGPGMPDWLCTGPNDRAMALACTGYQDPNLNGWWVERLSTYTKSLQDWMGSGKLGYAPLEVLHHWHGTIANRRYKERNERLLQIDWPRHCRYNDDGLLAWTEEGRLTHESWFRSLWTDREHAEENS